MFTALGRIVALSLVLCLVTVTAALAADGTGSIFELWGPFLGVIAAFVLFFDRLAKVIPSGTTNGVLKLFLMIASVLGVKIPDRQ